MAERHRKHPVFQAIIDRVFLATLAVMAPSEWFSTIVAHFKKHPTAVIALTRIDTVARAPPLDLPLCSICRFVRFDSIGESARFRCVERLVGDHLRRAVEMPRCCRMRNLGATCYFNSLLQQLLGIPASECCLLSLDCSVDRLIR
jgi:hypothetical protein